MSEKDRGSGRSKTNQQRMLEEMLEDAQARSSPMVEFIEKDLKAYRARMGIDEPITTQANNLLAVGSGIAANPCHPRC